MTASVVFQDQLEVPLNVGTLSAFRRWAQSGEFPDCGRVDYVGGRIEVDMTPESLFLHGTLKTKIAAVILHRAEQLELGHVLIDSTRVSHVEAQLSVEPDIVLVSQAAIDEGRIRPVAAASGRPDQFVEWEGSPDLVVEIVSDSSERKDTQRLPQAYFDAGVLEYWIVDARGERVSCQIGRRAAGGFSPVSADGEGFQRSGVLQCGLRLERTRGLGGFWQYELHVR